VNFWDGEGYGRRNTGFEGRARSVRERDAVHGIGRSLGTAGSGCVSFAFKLLLLMVLFGVAYAIVG
jgi:hypothetical protein